MIAIGAGALKLAGWKAKRPGDFCGDLEGQAKVHGVWISVNKVEQRMYMYTCTVKMKNTLWKVKGSITRCNPVRSVVEKVEGLCKPT